MWILDLTSLLALDKPNYYVLNPSILRISSNTYLIAYRIISYDLPIQVHPWSMWFSDYRIFKQKSSIARSSKYRSTLGPAIVHPLRSAPFVQDSPEYDSTGLALATLNAEGFRILVNIPCLFPHEYNQDARLVKCEDRMSIIYNVFESDGAKLRIRDVDISRVDIRLSEERYLFPHIYRPTEKHCTPLLQASQIQYSISHTHFTILTNKSLFSTKHNHFAALGPFAPHITLSLSTPLLPWTRTHSIAVGHAKIQYKHVSKLPFNLSKIHKHGKYIYTMFIYELDNASLTLSRVSPLFLPSVNANHEPYLLAMPIGLTNTQKDQIIISYGEGDVRAKALILSRSEVEKLLNSEMGIFILTTRLRLHHIGYWGKQNAGDEAFAHVFRNLYQNTPHLVSFGSRFDPNADLNILGGGDVMNSYFVPSNVPKHSIAIGVGIPYAEFEPYVSRFKRVYLRNARDAERLKVNYVPDLAFLLPWARGTPPCESKPIVGLVLTRTYYHTGHLDLYDDFVREISRCVNLMTQQGFRVELIPFCINSKEPGENDLLILQDVSRQTHAPIFRPDERRLAESVFRKIGELNFLICTRFHAHIFATMHATPFISLTCGRKCLEYMRDFPDCLYRLTANEIDLPIHLNGEALFRFFIEKWNNRRAIRERLSLVRDKSTRRAQKFAQGYLHMVTSLAKPGEMILWSPPGDSKTTPSDDPSSPPLSGDYKVLEPTHNVDTMPSQPSPLQMTPSVWPTHLMVPMSVPSPIQVLNPLQMSPTPVVLNPAQMSPTPVVLNPMQMSPTQAFPMQVGSTQTTPMLPMQMNPLQASPTVLPTQMFMQPIQMPSPTQVFPMPSPMQVFPMPSPMQVLPTPTMQVFPMPSPMQVFPTPHTIQMVPMLPMLMPVQTNLSPIQTLNPIQMVPVQTSNPILTPILPTHESSVDKFQNGSSPPVAA